VTRNAKPQLNACAALANGRRLGCEWCGLSLEPRRCWPSCAPVCSLTIALLILSAQLGSALVRLIHYMLPDCDADVVLVPFYLHAAGVARIAKLGWLMPAQTGDQQAVRAAFGAFVNRAGLLGVRPMPRTTS
jgi:hypothetical protein